MRLTRHSRPINRVLTLLTGSFVPLSRPSNASAGRLVSWTGHALRYKLTRSIRSAFARETEFKLASELLGPRTRGRPEAV